ncbi:MAG TPA: PEP/pyruvate-binding domain-containing protein [Polyangia bacterium]|nr:PEP/pyruvate-binding domain-containing protein [Polyangia bacterium]
MSDKRPRVRDSLIPQLQERAKELACLYRIEELLSNAERPLDEVFDGVVAAIPVGWQFPELCRATITFGDRLYASPGFVETPLVQCAAIIVQDRAEGRICVYYTEQMQVGPTGPFLPEEQRLVGTIATRLGHFVMHKRLRQTFDGLGAAVEESARGKWRVALDLIHRTDQVLLDRLARKMMNHLCRRGIPGSRELLERCGESLVATFTGESNMPSGRAFFNGFSMLVEETFQLAAEHISDDEILEQIQKWIDEDKSSFLVNAAADDHSPLTAVWDALRRFERLSREGVHLGEATRKSVGVALIRRFFTEQLDFVKVAKGVLSIEDFFGLQERVIAPANSHGRLGGKSSGLFVAQKVLEHSDKVLGGIKTPKTWYLTSDGLLEFLHYNNLEDVYEQKYKSVDEVRQEYPHIVQMFKNSHFPPDLVKGLSMALDDMGDVPLVVRSSSLLEDRTGAAFSGKYKSLFISNQGSKPERLEELQDAIAEVYASTFGPDPIEYRSERGLLDFNEEMAILIQEVVGRRVGQWFFPAFAGVAFSTNEFRWSPRIRRKDGLIRLVPGLGTRAVDRLTDDYPILVAPGQPKLRVNVTLDEVERYSPKKIDVIDLEQRRFTTIDLAELLRTHGAEYPAVGRVASVIEDGVAHRLRTLTTDFGQARIVADFSGLIDGTPFVEQVGAILSELEQALGTPVDIEFAIDGDQFYLLQCRPQSNAGADASVALPKGFPDPDVIFTADRYVSGGLVPDITHVVYVDPEGYAGIESEAELHAVGDAVGRLNKLLTKRRFILMGPGRWGSRGDIKLGVRVTYSDINNTAMLIEIARKKGGYVPDLSFGTHFFQDLVEARIRYLPLYPDDPGVRFNEGFLRASQNVLGDLLPEYVNIAETLRVIDVPGTTGGRVLRVYMNSEQDAALALLADPLAPADIDDPGPPGDPSLPADH